MTARRSSCWHAMDAKPSKRCSSTSHAAAPISATPPSERGARHEFRRRLRDLMAPDRRHDRALLVFAALVVAAVARAHLLAGGADADVGLSATLYRSERGLFRPCRRDLHRCRAVMGYPVPRPARIFGL